MTPNLSTNQAAEYLKSKGTPYSPGTLEVWRSQGRGPAFKRIGRRVFYTPGALDSFIEGETVQTIDSYGG